MRIGYLSSFPPIENGIATYTSYLEAATATHDVETFVVASHGAQGNTVFPTYTLGTGDFAPAVYEMLTQLTHHRYSVGSGSQIPPFSRRPEPMDAIT